MLFFPSISLSFLLLDTIFLRMRVLIDAAASPLTCYGWGESLGCFTTRLHTKAWPCSRPFYSGWVLGRGEEGGVGKGGDPSHVPLMQWVWVQSLNLRDLRLGPPVPRVHQACNVLPWTGIGWVNVLLCCPSISQTAMHQRVLAGHAWCILWKCII